jgi:signal transduction histidine kinase
MTLSFERYAANQLSDSCAQVTAEWAERVAQNGSEGAGRAHALQRAGMMPDVMRRVAEFLCDVDTGALRHDEGVRHALGTFVRLRREQGSGPATLLQEMDVLAEILDGACLRWIDEYPNGTPAPDSVVRVAGRLNRAPIILGEIGVEEYWQEEQLERRDVTTQLREFADRLSHELKTPLNAAGMTAQLLEYTDGALRSSESKRLVTLIRRNLTHAERLLQDVRDASLGDAGARRAVVRPFGQVLGEVLAAVHDEVVSEGVRLEVEEPVATIRVDAARVKLILVNLLRNAVRYSDPARPTRWVRITCVRNAAEGRWWVHISDNGLGIPAEHHADVFHRSFRAHPGRRPGTGLGLLIVRQEVEALGGRIDFSSEPGEGTTFRFQLAEAAANLQE